MHKNVRHLWRLPLKAIAIVTHDTEETYEAKRFLFTLTRIRANEIFHNRLNVYTERW